MLTGGKLLGTGVYGCVYVPPLECAPRTSISIPRNEKEGSAKKVDKLLSAKDADTEFKLAQRIQKIPLWDHYFVVADTMCKPALVQKEKDLNSCDTITGDDITHLRILRMNFGGEAVDAYKINIHKFNFRNFVTSGLEAVTLLLLNSICHMDLHSGNALLDKEQRIKFIDWNLAIDVATESDPVSRLFHSYTLKLTQESPDYLLMNAKYKKQINSDSKIPEESKLVLAMLDQKPILKKQRAVLGFTYDSQLKGIQDFIHGSKAYQANDYNAWFMAHWRMNDSWAIASMIVSMISKLSLWPEYKFPPEFTGSDSRGYQVLRKMCDPNPFKRHDAVQGLAELYPDNSIITTYAGAWLKSASPPA
jgi:serine/threonine protein kinase